MTRQQSDAVSFAPQSQSNQKVFFDQLICIMNFKKPCTRVQVFTNQIKEDSPRYNL